MMSIDVLPGGSLSTGPSSTSPSMAVVVFILPMCCAVAVVGG